MEIKIIKGTPKELLRYELLKMNHADLNSEELSDIDELKKVLSGYTPLKPSDKYRIAPFAKDHQKTKAK